MDVQKKLDEIVAAVEGARSMPMSASCVVNRAELLAMLEEVRAALPDSLAQAEAVLGGREQVVEEARREAERILASAHAERGSMVSDTEVARRSQSEADRILTEARREADEVKAEADDYVDSKLANFEVVLTKTLRAVDRGREKLLGRGPGVDEQGEPDADAPERSTDPDELRRRADEYVDTKMASFEAVLGRTLEAVGRGRQKLLGRQPTDELGEYAALEDEGAAPHAGQSDADYVAALAGQFPQQPAYPAPGRQPDPGHQADQSPYQDQADPAADPALDPAALAAAQQGYGDGYQYGGYPQDGYAAQQDPPYQPGADQYPVQPGYAPAYQDGGEYPAGDYQAGGQYAPGQYQEGGYQDAYGWQNGYSPDGAGYLAGGQDPQQDPQLQPQQLQPQQDQAGYGGSLDETSFFDTSLIDVQRLRELDGGR